ncbi:helix-turn-helix transcriptional regulator [Lacinutrix sp.]|uniref:helix-turn-helix domain-containing protein n=1 Tax=Lacinutrix sp. TaxID=1937692 RepID=UPI0025C597EB|nr:helix-turn-helix transcriptional regulator [Lacinutrix sp.]
MTKSKNNLLSVAIAKKIKSLRQKNSVTQEVFYFDTGIHLGRIEQGKSNITLNTLDIICNYFEIPLKEFFSDLDY